MDMQIHDVAQAVIDCYRGDLQKFSQGQTNDLLHNALVELNGGSTKLDFRRIRDGECKGMFALVEEILDNTVVEGLQGDEFFNSLVEFRNMKMGDENIFEVEDSNLYTVSQSAEGTLGIRRQRLSGTSQVSITTRLYTVRIYEELNRILAGRVDLNKMIDRVGMSFRQKMLNDAYALWTSATADDLGGAAFYPVAAPYSEATLLNVINHVEAASGGKTCTILGTKTALRHLQPAIISNSAKEDIYNLGFVGKFYGSNVVAIPQRHKIGTTDFVFDDKTLTIVAGDDKPIKCVREGDSIVLPPTTFNNADMTQEYYFGDRYGLGLVLAGNHGLGVYKIQSQG